MSDDINMNLVEIVKSSISKANLGISKIPDNFAIDDALSGYKGRALINNICSFSGINYLEVGSYAGSTFASALCGNSIHATAVDIWEKFIEQPRATRVKKRFNERINMFKGNNDVRVIENSIYDQSTIDTIGNDINFFFYDADHTVDATRLGIINAYKTFTNNFIMLIDDYAMVSTRAGVSTALQILNVDLQFEQELGSMAPYDWYSVDGQKRLVGAPDWWCNYYICVGKKH